MKAISLFTKLSAFFCYFIISSSAYSQCLEEGQVFLPEPVISNGDLFGNPMTGYNDYLLASASNSDLNEFNGGLAYLYKLTSGTWTKLAEFKPSEYKLEMYFGRKTVMDNNLVLIAGNTYTPEGFHFDELFVYTKKDNEEWTSTTESYRITLRNDLNATGLVVRELVIKNNILGVSYGTAYEDNIAFYKINPDLSIEYVTTLEGPSNGTYSNDNFASDFDFTDEFIAVRGTYPERAVYVYDLNNVLNNSEHQPIALLKPGSGNHQDFANQIEMDDEHIYAANAYNYTNPVEFPTEVYVFKKPDAGWADSFESAVLNTKTTNYYGYNHQLKLYEDYLFLSRDYGKEIFIFKKSGEWYNATPDLIINKEKDHDDDYRHFALDFAVFNNHIVANYIGDYYKTGPNNNDKLISYHAPGGAFENITDFHQEISETYLSATESRFGQNLSYSNDRLAVGAPGDNINGRNAGAVYLYEKNDQTENFAFSTTIRPPDGNSGDAFGNGIELVDSLLFISSTFYDSLNEDGSYFNGSIGKVYQYALEGDRWVLKSILFSPEDISIKDMKHFGRSISYSNGYVAISQYYTGSSESNGTVHIFKMLEGYQWEHVATMKTKDQQGGDFFGSNIILQDSLLVVGTGNPAYGYTDEMRVYLFKKNGGEWESKTEDAYLVPSVINRGDRFGFSINMNRDLIVVGAPGYNYGDTKKFAGRAYVFKRPKDGWEGRIEETLIIEPKDPKEEDFFGFDVFIDENNILIGAASSINNPYSAWSTSDISDLQPGKIYFFDPYSENDQLIGKRNERYIQLSDNNRYLDAFGYDIEGAYDRVFISAIYDNNTSGFRAGAVFELKYTTYIYRVKDPVCGNGEPFYLKSNRLGGYWSGEGIADSLTGLFDPSRVKQYGWTLVTYTAGDCRVTTSLYIGLLPQITSKSESEISKCKGDKVNLFVNYTSAAGASTEWHYKNENTDNYEFLKSDTDSLEVLKPGFYKVEIKNGLCQPVMVEFTVSDRIKDTELNYQDFVEVCSYDHKSLTLKDTTEVQNISWYIKEPNTPNFIMSGSEKELNLNKSGFYFATFVTNNCTFNSDTVEVYFNHLDLTFEDPGIICEPSYHQLIAAPGGGIWTGTEISEDGVVDIHKLNDGLYTAIYEIQQDGCLFENSVQFEVLVLPEPQITFSKDEVCPRQPADLTILNNPYDAEINWFKIGKEGSRANSDQFITDEPGEYFAEFALKGCVSTSDSILLTTKKDSLFVPNVITSNNDGANEDFRIYKYGINDLKLTILNRWGKIIYTDDNQEIIWKPGDQPSGIYYWYIQYMNCLNEKTSLKGWLHVLND